MYVPEKLTFVFKSDWIEKSFKQNFPMECLFEDQSDQLVESIGNFYKNVWPMSCPSSLDDKSQFLTTVLNQCFKLCIWWKIDGKNRLVFRKIIDTFRKLVSNCITRADNIFKHEFAFVNKVRQINCLLKDNVALNLVQAVCFYLARFSYCLIKSISDIPNSEVHQKEFSVDLTLIRPGLIDLLSTLDTTMDYLNMLKIKFIAFNDQFDYIGRSINATQFLIIRLYRDMYVKLSWQWLTQTELLIYKVASNSCPKSVAALKFILVVGVHFIVRFHRQFRRDFSEFRKKFLKFDSKLQNIKHFDFNKYVHTLLREAVYFVIINLIIISHRYKSQVDEIFRYEINSNGSVPFLTESLEAEIVEVLGLRSKTPFEYLKQFNINVDLLQ